VSVALVIHHTNRMRLPGCTIFFHVINDKIFGKKVLNIKCVLWISVQHLSETFFTLRRNDRGVNINVFWSSWKVQVLLLYFNGILVFPSKFRKIFKYIIFFKIMSLGSDFSTQTDGRTDRHTDMTNIIVAFRNFAKAFENRSAAPKFKWHTVRYRLLGSLEFLLFLWKECRSVRVWMRIRITYKISFAVLAVITYRRGHRTCWQECMVNCIFGC
jgi:hypothetical protein